MRGLGAVVDDTASSPPTCGECMSKHVTLSPQDARGHRVNSNYFGADNIVLMTIKLVMRLGRAISRHVTEFQRCCHCFD